MEPLTIELRLPTTIRATFDGLEVGDPSAGIRKLGTIKVFGQIALQRVVAGQLVELAAFLVEPHPEPPLRCSTLSARQSGVV